MKKKRPITALTAQSTTAGSEEFTSEEKHYVYKSFKKTMVH
jgi:hypothetical protein